MVELSNESKRTIQELAQICNPTRKNASAKRKHLSEKTTLLSAMGVPHDDKCVKCLLNCEVNHAADVDFWAKTDGLEPKYGRKSCPKQGHITKAGIGRKKRGR